MAFFDLRMEVAALAAAHRLDEVLPGRPTQHFARSWILVLAEEYLITRIAVDRHIALRTVKDIAYRVRIRLARSLIHFTANPGFMVGDPVSHLVNEHDFLAVLIKLEARDLCVRRLLIVIKHEMAAHRLNLG